MNRITLTVTAAAAALVIAAVAPVRAQGSLGELLQRIAGSEELERQRLEADRAAEARAKTLEARHKQDPANLEILLDLTRAYIAVKKTDDAMKLLARGRELIQAQPEPTLKPQPVDFLPSGVQPPVRIHVEHAKMPRTSRALEEAVTVEFVIDRFGRVRDAKILGGIELLQQVTLDAVNKWEFVPTLIDGRAVPVWSTTTVIFKTLGGD